MGEVQKQEGAAEEGRAVDETEEGASCRRCVLLGPHGISSQYQSPAPSPGSPTAPALPAAPYRQGVSRVRESLLTQLSYHFSITTPTPPYHELQIRQTNSASVSPPPLPALFPEPPLPAIMAQLWRALDRVRYRVSLGFHLPELTTHDSLVGISCGRLPPSP